MAERPYTVAEVAERERVSSKSIYTEIHAGRLPAYKIGAHYRIDDEALAKWKDGVRVRPRAESRADYDGFLNRRRAA